MISLFIGKTYKSLVEKKFNPDDEIILEPVGRFLSKEPFIKKKRKSRAALGAPGRRETLTLFRIVYEDGIYKEKTPNVPLPRNYTEEDTVEAKKKLLDMVLNNTTYITKPIKIKVKDVIKIPISQLKQFWRYKVPLPEINNPSQLTEFQIRISYYLGYWLGDGTAASPGSLTVGKEDQPSVEIVLKQLAEYINLTLTMGKTKKGLRCTLCKGRDGKGRKQHASYLQEDWVSNVTAACEELEISKKTLSSYQNFKNNYDPVSKYKKGEDYYYDDNNGRKFNTEHIVKIGPPRRQNAKKNRFVQYMRETQSIDIPHSHKVWSSKTDEEKKKYKLPQINKKEIMKKYGGVVKNLHRKTFCEYYKTWEADKINGLQNFVDEYRGKISPILIEFTKLNLINNKHIPEIYFTAPLEVRKQLLAGLIDSDGGREPHHYFWSFSQSLDHKRIIDDVERLAQSLGHFTRRKDRITKYTYKGEKSEKPSIRLSITPYYNYDIPLIYERKRLPGNTTQLPSVTHEYKNNRN